MGTGIGIGVGLRQDGGGAAPVVPASPLRDRAGNLILDRDGNTISPRGNQPS